MTRQALALLLVVVVAAFAGCSGDAGGGSTPTPTLESTDADALAADAADEMAAAERYRVSGTVEQTVTANNQRRSARVAVAAAFDRGARTFRVTQTVTANGQTTARSSYLVNGTLYEHDPAYERAYGAEWVRVDVSANLTSAWRAQDTLTRQRLLLENASVSLEGAATVNGTRTAVLAVDGDESAFETVVERRLNAVGSSAAVSVENVSFTHYVAVESNRLRRAVGTLEMTVESNGRTVAQTQRLNLTVTDYGAPVSVSLPEGASVAVAVGNESS
jgi:hypothetical protein